MSVLYFDVDEAVLSQETLPKATLLLENFTVSESGVELLVLKHLSLKNSFMNSPLRIVLHDYLRDMVQMLAHGLHACRILQIGSRAYKWMLIFLGKNHLRLSRSTGMKLYQALLEFYIRKNTSLEMCLDMRAGFEGFAAALIENKLDCWALNVVPVSGPNTLLVIYTRGLIGVMHDW